MELPHHSVNFLVFKLTWKSVGLRLAISVMLLGSPLGHGNYIFLLMQYWIVIIQPMQCHYEHDIVVGTESSKRWLGYF